MRSRVTVKAVRKRNHQPRKAESRRHTPAKIHNKTRVLGAAVAARWATDASGSNAVATAFLLVAINLGRTPGSFVRCVPLASKKQALTRSTGKMLPSGSSVCPPTDRFRLYIQDPRSRHQRHTPRRVCDIEVGPGLSACRRASARRLATVRRTPAKKPAAG
jgi:hypothetical protein